MKRSHFLNLVRADLFRYSGCVSIKEFVVQYFINHGLCVSFWFRAAHFLRGTKILLPVYIIVWLIYREMGIRHGIDIPASTSIGPGFYIGHSGGIVVHGLAKIGANCNISHGVTLGQANRGERQGYPTIGNNVYIGPGAKIFGNVHVGDRVAIGANCVVTHDVPDNAVVVGIPGKIISYDGVEGYVTNPVETSMFKMY